MSRPPLILLSEMDEVFGQDLRKRLLQRQFKVLDAPETHQFYRDFQESHPDLIIISNLHRGLQKSFELVRRIRSKDRFTPIVFISMDSSEDLIIAAMRAGVNDFLKMPFSTGELVDCVNRNLGFAPAGSLESELDDVLVGESPIMRKVKKYLERIAAVDSTVLITGETGTGKELAAKFIYRHSRRRKKTLVCLDCAALPETILESELFGYERGAFTGATVPYVGKLYLANEGTLFLDEIGELSLKAQAKLLRVIESKEYFRLGGKTKIPLDVRIITATNQVLEDLVNEKKFRKDLYYRLDIARVHMPALSERKEDIPAIADHYLRILNRRYNADVRGLTAEALSMLSLYSFPGNVRELQNLLERIYIQSPPKRISAAEFPAAFRKKVMTFKKDKRTERDRLIEALVSANWNKSKAAEKLQWSRMTVYRKIKAHQISEEAHPPA